MDALEQGVEVEMSGGFNHDLAVDDETGQRSVSEARPPAQESTA